MTKFNLKVTSNGIKIFLNNKEQGSSKDFKEVLAFVAHTIVEDDIDDYKIFVSEQGTTTELKNFDPESVLKNSKKYNFDDDDDDSDDDDDDDRNRNRNSRSRNSHSNREEEPQRKRFVYTSNVTKNDYTLLGLTLADVLTNNK